MNFLRVLAVCGRTRNFLQLLADRIWNFWRIKHNLTSFHRLRVLAAQELLAPLFARALFLGCTVFSSHRFDIESFTHNRFPTCNICHTKRISDSREKRDEAREKREMSREKRDSSREKRDERW